MGDKKAPPALCEEIRQMAVQLRTARHILEEVDKRMSAVQHEVWRLEEIVSGGTTPPTQPR
jgi:hypothetical protein